MSPSRVVIIGGGLAGLASAALLMDEGFEIVLVEEDANLGGKLRSMDRDGFRLDAGLHCFHYGDSGSLGELNERLGLGLAYLETRDAGYILRGKDRIPVPSEADTNPKDVPGLSDDEAERVKRWFSLVMETDPASLKKKSIADFVAEAGFAEDDLVGDYAAALGLALLGRDPASTSASMMVAHAQAVGHPGFHTSSISGGPNALVDMLAEKVKAGPVEIILGRRAQSIELADNRAAAVSLGEEKTPADAVIYTGPPRLLPDMIEGGEISSNVVRKVSRMKPVSAVAVEYGLSSPVTGIKGVMLDPAEAIIGRFPSNLDPLLAPEGKQIASWMALADPEDLDDKKTTRSHIKRLQRIIKRHFPEIFDNIAVERLRVIPVVTSMAPLASQADYKLPAKIKGAENLFLAGDGAGTGAVLSGAAVKSAMDAAARVSKLPPPDGA